MGLDEAFVAIFVVSVWSIGYMLGMKVIEAEKGHRSLQENERFSRTYLGLDRLMARVWVEDVFIPRVIGISKAPPIHEFISSSGARIA